MQAKRQTDITQTDHRYGVGDRSSHRRPERLSGKGESKYKTTGEPPVVLRACLLLLLIGYAAATLGFQELADLSCWIRIQAVPGVHQDRDRALPARPGHQGHQEDQIVARAT